MIRFVEPIDGDILISGIDGDVVDGTLWADVSVQCESPVSICGMKAEQDNGLWHARVPLQSGKGILVAQAEDGTEATARVWWLKGAERKYRFTVDDCIRCFEDLTRNADRYASLFENPFLAIWKRCHDLWGSMVHINVFYESVDGQFDLSMMTDKFREEFRANANWLKLTFHAQAEFPDAPYKSASFEKVAADCERCTREIIRFAGEEVLSQSTTLHWGAANAAVVQALAQAGFKALCAYLRFDKTGETLVSYHLSKEQVAHATAREGWVDFDNNLLFAKLDFVLNEGRFPAEAVAPYLDELEKIPHEGQFIQMVIHEQYFYPDYQVYMRDYAERIYAMAQWMHAHGYESVSLSELVADEI